MKKITIILLLSFLISCLSFALAESIMIDLDSSTNSELLDAIASIEKELGRRNNHAPEILSGTSVEGVIGRFSASVNEGRFSLDYKNDPCIVIDIEWTNNSDETLNSIFALNVAGYQNGVQLDTPVMIDDVDIGKHLLNLRPGGSISIDYALILRDQISPVEIELADVGDYSMLDTLVKTFEFASTHVKPKENKALSSLTRMNYHTISFEYDERYDVSNTDEKVTIALGENASIFVEAIDMSGATEVQVNEFPKLTTKNVIYSMRDTVTIQSKEETTLEIAGQTAEIATFVMPFEDFSITANVASFCANGFGYRIIFNNPYPEIYTDEYLSLLESIKIIER